MNLACIVLGIDATVAAACRVLAEGGCCFVIMDADSHAGHRLTLALNTGSRGRAVFVPGDPEQADDRAEALAECARCWPGQPSFILAPAGRLPNQ